MAFPLIFGETLRRFLVFCGVLTTEASFSQYKRLASQLCPRLKMSATERPTQAADGQGPSFSLPVFPSENVCSPIFYRDQTMTSEWYKVVS